MDKILFVKEEFLKLISSLSPDAKGKWGKMNAQQMVEHMSYSFRLASGRHVEKSFLTPEQTQKGYSFVMTDKSFRENTQNPLLSPEPDTIKNSSMSAAIEGLKAEINYFFEVYDSNKELRIINPFYGNLNFEEQVQLLHKHCEHHAKQFGLVE